MVTNNIKKMLASPYNCVNTQGNNVSASTGTSSSAGHNSFFGQNMTFSKSATSTSGTQEFAKYFDVGFGDTPATADDYVLADGNMYYQRGSATSGVYLNGRQWLDVVSQAQNTKNVGEIDNFTVTLKNNTNQTVTVKEIGVYTNCGQTSTSINRLCLTVRKVLSTPIVFAPGDQYAITYSLSLNI